MKKSQTASQQPDSEYIEQHNLGSTFCWCKGIIVIQNNQISPSKNFVFTNLFYQTLM